MSVARLSPRCFFNLTLGEVSFTLGLHYDLETRVQPGGKRALHNNPGEKKKQNKIKNNPGKKTKQKNNPDEKTKQKNNASEKKKQSR